MLFSGDNPAISETEKNTHYVWSKSQLHFICNFLIAGFWLGFVWLGFFGWLGFGGGGVFCLFVLLVCFGFFLLRLSLGCLKEAWRKSYWHVFWVVSS